MTYDHTQRSPLYLILVILAGAEGFIGCWLLRVHIVVAVVLWSSAFLMALLAFCFKQLTVRDNGEHLAVRFGPIPLFRRRIAYSNITSIEPGRSPVLDGWGIHYGPGRGWIWNLWGFDCVNIELGKKAVRIGTDDVEGLVSFLKQRIPPRHQS